MAQGVSSSVATNGVALTAAELREILEYEKIVHFRDAVLAGTHPRIKIPPHLLGKQVNISNRTASSPSHSTPSRASATRPANRSISGTNQEISSPYNSMSPNNHRTSNAYGSMSFQSEINPILLEKSDDLIKAEIQLQRQRLERALREQIEQQWLAAKLQTSEGVPNFDVGEVLSKALAIVHPSTAAGAEPSVGALSSASDSFDENTFYSSQHDTPVPSSSSQGQQEPLEVQAGLADGRPAQIYSTNAQIGNQDVVMTGASLSADHHLQGSQSRIPHLQQKSRDAAIHYEQAREMNHSDSSNSIRETRVTVKVSSQDKRPNTVSVLQHKKPSKSADMGSLMDFCESGIDDSGQNTSDELLRQAFEDDSESQMIRAHNLSPYAPQPARVSPLATARNPPVLRETLPIDEAPPAQVAALRQSRVSSTDSSPKGVKTTKKKEKKKKRKASSKDGLTMADSPYIKPEPRSPSPFGVVPLPRPQKRQRQTGQFGEELNYDEPRYEERVQESVIERVPDRYKEPLTYARYEEHYEIEPRRPERTYQRVERDDVEYRRLGDSHYVRRPQSPAIYTLPHGSGEPRSVRAASHAIVDRRPREEPVYYRESLPRASVRPDADRERSRSPIVRERRSPIPMGPPRQPIRIVVDAYGREYIDPNPPPSMRQSVAPAVRHRDADVVYERAPVRTVSGRPPVEYEENGVLYRRPASPVVVPRRVVTQPEYAAPEHRAYRQREYSVRPMAPPGEDYIQLRGGAERRQMSHFDEAPREFIPRAASVRPAPAESIRYEVPRDYVSRVGSARPEGASRELAAQSQREYSVRPVEAPRREQIGGRVAERYYGELPSRRPITEANVSFIEKPRAREQSVLVFENDVRREVRDVYR